MNSHYKKIDIKTRKLVSSLFLGNYKAAFQGKGMEFVDFREYNYGDDAKDIDWLVSAREGKILVRRYQEERELEILFVCDMTPSMSFEYGGKTKKNLLQELIYMLGFAALQNGDSVGAYFLGRPQNIFFPFGKGMQRIQKIFSLLESSSMMHSQKRDIEKILSLKLKNKLIFFCSDSFDIDNYTLKILAKQNDVIFLHISDIFEDTLKGEGLRTLKNLTQRFSISLGDESKIHAYQKLRESKKRDFRKTLRSLGIETVFFNTESHIYALILELMKRRESRR